MPDEPQVKEAPAKAQAKKKGTRLAIGIILGLALGAAIGVATGNFAIGIPMGAAFGAALGILDEEANSGKLNPKQEKIVLFLEYAFGILLVGAIVLLIVI
ncbi:MAG: hypothetical protein CVT47_00120 [Thermoplasmata archaeon HGW-Thermoplasmata-2]|nr:MAG: hypothetical protein CVT47_00120 [Thermoplasmata archaeon HGW-Thermoplasmata-2]